jgi:hypothetical protein
MHLSLEYTLSNKSEQSIRLLFIGKKLRGNDENFIFLLLKGIVISYKNCQLDKLQIEDTRKPAASGEPARQKSFRVRSPGFKYSI